MEQIFIIAILITGIFILPIVLITKVLKLLKTNANLLELIIGITYFYSLLLFTFGISYHDNQYYTPIDPNEECYSPFSDKHANTLLFYFLAFNISTILIWTKGKILPPLTLTLSLVFTLAGVCIALAVLFQITIHEANSMEKGDNGIDQLFFLFAPIFVILIGTSTMYESITQEIEETFKRSYSNIYLNFLNSFLAKRSKNPFWIVLLLFPVLLTVTLILILFGQDVNSLVKVFTDTTTWRLSQQSHPPVLHPEGHYLCTVAARGNPSIVKPLRIGVRNGSEIIVNRQLLVANAFEELVQDLSPKLHRIIRNNYDRYGLDLSKQINTIHLSNLTYVLMKPLEFIFLAFLYLFCTKPEEKINRQYKIIKN